MMIPENVRLDDSEKLALILALKDVDDEVYIHGSRLELSKRGGDIDLLIFSKRKQLDLSRRIFRQFFMECEEKIDVIVFDKENLTEEQKAFISTLNLLRIK
jgi:predicted nucleotidyltransferase